MVFFISLYISSLYAVSPAKNILWVKPNSNLYKDHPNLEPNLYFYRDNSGVVRAEYLDGTGEPKQSKYFEPSTTGIRQQNVSLGSNGEWLSHDIEVKGRDYNSHEISKVTSIKTREADPSKQTKAFEETSKTELANDGIKYSEMYLIQNAEKIINSLIEQGYQKKEAIKIFDYMIGEEQLTLKEAKQKVNEEIGNKGKEDRQVGSVEERTPWGDAEARRLT